MSFLRIATERIGSSGIHLQKREIQMKMQKRTFLLSAAACAMMTATGAMAMGTPSGFAVVGFNKQGSLGEVIVNP